MNTKRKYTDEQLLNFLIDLKIELGKTPSSTDVDKKEGLPKSSLYNKRFGSFKNALSLIGLSRDKVKSDKYTDSELKAFYKEMCNYFGKSPTATEIEEYRVEINNNIPSARTFITRFDSLSELSRQVGLKHIKNKYSGIEKDFLIEELKRYNEEFGHPPRGKDLDKSNKGYPSRKTYEKHFGSFGDALLKAGFPYRGNKHFSKKPLPKGVDYWTRENLKEYFLKYISEFGRIPTCKEIDLADGYPTRQAYRRLFGNFNEAVREFGFEPVRISSYSDKELKDAFDIFVKKNSRIPNLQEFNNSEYPSFWCYQNRFGSWNEAVKTFGYEPFSHKTIEDLQKDIIKLCNDVHIKENRKIITFSDIDKSDYCSSAGTYSKNFRKHLNMTVREFVISIGFDMPSSGLGMVYEFEDGEITTSKYEFNVTTYFKEKNIKYDRNVRYDSFVDDYIGRKDCDYVINIDGKLWYVEIAGILDCKKSGEEYSDKIHIDYKEKMTEKEEMLIESKVDYKIIYPRDFKTKSLDEIFSFLNQPVNV